MNDFSERWMWSEACEMLARAEQLHRQLFQPTRAQGRALAWEPPVDMLETERELLVLIALPGVDPDRVKLSIDGAHLVVAGLRVLPPQLETAVIHRLELPQGHFERRILLPAGQYGHVGRSAAYGLLVVTLVKTRSALG
jgi:HSP20 family molecular chaperone IbpA